MRKILFKSHKWDNNHLSQFCEIIKFFYIKNVFWEVSFPEPHKIYATGLKKKTNIPIWSLVNSFFGIPIFIWSNLNLCTYTNLEKADMHFIYSKASGNANRVKSLYKKTFPNRRAQTDSYLLKFMGVLQKMNHFYMSKDLGIPSPS